MPFAASLRKERLELGLKHGVQRAVLGLAAAVDARRARRGLRDGW